MKFEMKRKRNGFHIKKEESHEEFWIRARLEQLDKAKEDGKISQKQHDKLSSDALRQYRNKISQDKSLASPSCADDGRTTKLQKRMRKLSH